MKVTRKTLEHSPQERHWFGVFFWPTFALDRTAGFCILCTWALFRCYLLGPHLERAFAINWRGIVFLVLSMLVGGHMLKTLCFSTKENCPSSKMMYTLYVKWSKDTERKSWPIVMIPYLVVFVPSILAFNAQDQDYLEITCWWYIQRNEFHHVSWCLDSRVYATQKLVCDEVNKESDPGLLQKPAQKTIVEYTQK